MGESEIKNKRIRDKIEYGPYEGRTFIEVYKLDMPYFKACVDYIPEFYFDPISICMLLNESNYQMQEKHLIYLLNYERPYKQENYIHTFSKLPGFSERIERKNDIEDLIVQNLKDKFFSIEKHNDLDKKTYQSTLELTNDDGLLMSDIQSEQEGEILCEIQSKRMAWERELKDLKEDQLLLDVIEKSIKLKDYSVVKCRFHNIRDISVFELCLKFIALLQNITKTVPSKKRKTINYNSTSFWNCDICDGNETTGCMYFDTTECPKWKD